MYSLFIEASKIDQSSRRMEQLRKLVRELPDYHFQVILLADWSTPNNSDWLTLINYFQTLKFMTHHLCQVAEHSSVNKMEVRILLILIII